MRSWLGLLVVGCIGLAGCSGAVGGEDEAGGPGLVMLDAEARAAGFSLVTEQGMSVPVAPAALEGKVSLVGPGQRFPLVGAAGELLVVSGRRGKLVARSLGSEVDADAVRVEGTEEGVRALAARLGARVTAGGVLRAPGLVARLAHEELPAGVSAVEVVDVEEAAQVAVARVAAEAASGSTPFSAGDARFASFGPLGEHALACGDPTAGTWVSVPRFNERFEDWRVFTLEVPAGSEPGAMRGTLHAHIWSGGPEDAAPDECRKGMMDYRVSMETVGVRGEDGSVRVDAGPWALEEGSCGETPGYNPDHLVGRVEGGAIRSVNNDGGRAVNDPVGFERVSCE